MLGKDVLETRGRNFFIWEKHKNSRLYSSCCIWAISSRGLLPSPVLKEKCPVLKKAPALGIVHRLQYLFVIVLLEVLTCSTRVPPIALEPPRVRRTLLRAVEDAQMSYSVPNSWEQERVSHPCPQKPQPQSNSSQSCTADSFSCLQQQLTSVKIDCHSHQGALRAEFCWCSEGSWCASEGSPSYYSSMQKNKIKYKSQSSIKIGTAISMPLYPRLRW